MGKYIRPIEFESGDALMSPFLEEKYNSFNGQESVIIVKNHDFQQFYCFILAESTDWKWLGVQVESEEVNHLIKTEDSTPIKKLYFTNQNYAKFNK